MIRHLLLDLDNTLYPASGGMDEGIRRRMLDFVERFLGVPADEATRLRQAGLGKYGTTLEWLRSERGLADENEFFLAVHPDSEIDELQPDPNLRPFLLSLGLPITLLTNAPKIHADRVLGFFGISDVFTGVFDLNWHGGRGKPHPECFLGTLKAVGYTVAETVFVDDLPKYTRGYKALGGRSVLVDEKDEYAEIAKAEGFGRIRSIYGLADWLRAARAEDGNS